MNENMDQVMDQFAEAAKKAGAEVTELPAQAAKKVSEKTKVVIGALGGTALGYGIARGVDAIKEHKNTTELDRAIKQRDELDKKIADLQAKAAKKADNTDEVPVEETSEE